MVNFLSSGQHLCMLVSFYLASYPVANTFSPLPEKLQNVEKKEPMKVGKSKWVGLRNK